MSTRKRFVENYYGRSSQSNHTIFSIAIKVLKKREFKTIMIGPFQDRLVAMAGLFVSGSEAELTAFQVCMGLELPKDLHGHWSLRYCHT